MPAPSAAPRGARAVVGVAVACAAQLLVGLDGLAVAIALPSIQSGLGVAAIDAQWVLTAYGLTFGSGLLIGGRLGDRYGPRRTLVGGLLTFTAGALVAAVAPRRAVLVAARVVQGLGAAAAVPATLALIAGLFPPGPGRTRALSWLAAMTSAGVISGLLVGGIVTQLLGWRAVFWLAAPLAAVSALLALRVLPDDRRTDRDERAGAGGAALAATGLAAMLLGLTRVQRSGPADQAVLVPLLVGSILIALFVARERRAAAPLVRPALLRIASLRAATLGAGCNAIVFTATVYLGTLYLQVSIGDSPLEAAVAILPLDLVALGVPLLAQTAIARRAPRPVLAASFTLSGLALLWLARAPVPAHYARDVLPAFVVLGASLSVAFVVLTQQAVVDVDAGERGMAAALFETGQHLFGGAVGVALYATVLTAVGAGVSDPSGYRAGFLTAALLAAAGLLVAFAHRPRDLPPVSRRAERGNRAPS